MKASELRIGIWVYLFGEAVQLTKEHIIYLLQKDGLPEPITLTEEWLSRAEYQYANENGQKFYWHLELPYFQLRKDEHGWLMWFYESGAVDALISKKDIGFVHHLQNIHFELSGEELVIK